MKALKIKNQTIGTKPDTLNNNHDCEIYPFQKP